MIHPFLPARAGALVALSTALLFTLFSSLLFSPGAAAQYFDDGRLTILITPSRFAETADETLAPVSVITREQIESSQADTVEEVLRTVPGVAFGNNGGVGKLTSLFLRGTESNHVLVLIDGVKVGRLDFGTTPFEFLPLDQIERIEVVRGPRSSLYGSEAIGGVVQIFTRKADGNTAPRFSIGAGSHNTAKIDAGVSGGDKAAWYSVGASAHSTDGYDACVTSFCRPGSAFGDDTGNDADAFKNTAISLRGGGELSDGVNLEGNFLQSESENEYDGSSNEAEHTARVANIKATWRGERNQTSLSIGRSEDDRDDLKDGAFQRNTDSTRDQVSVQNQVQLNQRNKLIAGVDYVNDKIESTTDYAATERDNTGLFALWRSDVGNHDFELSARNDDNEQFGNHATGNVAWGKTADDGSRITIAYSTAFSAPTLGDLYFPGYSNPDLKPESSQSVDIGFSQTNAREHFAFNMFHTRIKDLIIAPPPAYSPINVATASIVGVEVVMQQRNGPWQWGANLTLQNPRNEDTGEQLERRPKSIFNLDIDRQFGKLRLGATLHMRGDSDDSSARNESFALLNLRGEMRINEEWKAQLTINNAFEKEYETAAGYPQDGRNYLFTLRYKPIPQ